MVLLHFPVKIKKIKDWIGNARQHKVSVKKRCI